jgi:hypothetical protein
VATWRDSLATWRDVLSVGGVEVVERVDTGISWVGGFSFKL